MPSDVTYVWGPTTGHPNGTPTSRQEILHRLHEPTQAIEVGDLGYVGVLGSESQMKPAVPALMKEHWHFTGITLSHLIFFSKPTTSRMLNEEGWIIYIYTTQKVKFEVNDDHFHFKERYCLKTVFTCFFTVYIWPSMNMIGWSRII